MTLNFEPQTLKLNDDKRIIRGYQRRKNCPRCQFVVERWNPVDPGCHNRTKKADELVFFGYYNTVMKRKTLAELVRRIALNIFLSL